jgi:hypothetical protein
LKVHLKVMVHTSHTHGLAGIANIPRIGKPKMMILSLGVEKRENDANAGTNSGKSDGGETCAKCFELEVVHHVIPRG